MDEIKIEMVRLKDAKEILEIYSYYVINTAITFEYEVPSLEEFENRIKNVLTRYPYITAKKNNKIIGYAYAGSFNPRAAYDYAVETTIYVDHHSKRLGVGKKLYSSLENILKEQGILNLNACIAYPAVEDEYLTKNSVEYHKNAGYRFVGEFYQCGYKFNRWYNMVWMEKMIGVHLENQPPIKTFNQVKSIISQKYSIE